MRVLGLDIAGKTGWAMIESSRPGEVTTGLLQPSKGSIKSGLEVEGFLNAGLDLGQMIENLVKTQKPDFIVIEQTNLGKSRTTQKYLEFLHFGTLAVLQESGHLGLSAYIDSSEWRSGIGLALSGDQRKHNKLVKAKLAKGKLTWKHLSVAWANKTFDLKLKQKDDDIADAICLAAYGVIKTTGLGRSYGDIVLGKLFPTSGENL